MLIFLVDVKHDSFRHSPQHRHTFQRSLGSDRSGHSLRNCIADAISRPTASAAPHGFARGPAPAVERLCRRDAGYRFIVGDEAPDRTVIAWFRQQHAGRMKSAFLQVLERIIRERTLAARGD